jgi:hypothetical protein
LFEGLEKRVKKNNRGGEVISYWKDGVMVYKSCSRCGEIKEVGCFEKKKGKYRPECRMCRNKEKREGYHKNKDKHKKRNQKYYQEHKEYWVERNKKQTEERRSSPTYIEKKRKQEEGRIEKARIKAEEKARLREIAKANRVKTPLEIAAAKERERIASRKRYHLKRELEREKRHLKNEEHKKEAVRIMEKYAPLINKLNLNKYGYIYKFENTKTGRVYIGQTILPLTVRYQENIIGNWIKERLNKASQKFKEELIEEDFEITEVLAVGCCRWHLDKLEVYYIDKFNSQHNGYNIQGGNYHSDDGIEEFNQILKENNLQFRDGELRII